MKFICPLHAVMVLTEWKWLPFSFDSELNVIKHTTSHGQPFVLYNFWMKTNGEMGGNRRKDVYIPHSLLLADDYNYKKEHLISKGNGWVKDKDTSLEGLKTEMYLRLICTGLRFI